MQKKLIALAVAGLASTAAFAQTNVTIYGIADGTFDVIDVSNSLNSGDNYGWNNRVQANSSYIGFKGTEDLGNGLKAIFQYEAGVDFTSGAGAVALTRDSFVGVSSGAGTVVLGNLTAPTRALGAALDVNAGATGIGSNSAIIGKFSGVSGVGTLGAGATALTNARACAQGANCASRFDTRWGNAIAYMSPNWGGFSFAGAYVADENKTPESLDNLQNTAAATAAPNGALRTTGFDVGAKWEGYGFMAGVTYNWFQIGDLAQNKADNLRFGGSYGGAWGSVRAMWEVTNYEGNNTTFANGIYADDQQQKWGVGATFNIGKAQLLAQYYEALKSENVSDNGAWFAEAGVQYNLSKRTMLKTVYAYLDNQANSMADFGVGASGARRGATVQGLQIGVRHAF